MLGIIAGCISFFAFVPYIVSIVKGKTIPNRATWLIWSWVGILLLFSYKASGATDTLWVAISYTIAPIIISFLSFKYGVGGWNKFDLFCISGSVISTLLWFITGSPTLALILFLIIDFFGSLPTIKKSYFYPEQENKLAWLLMVIANFLNIFAAEEIRFSIIVYPLYMFIVGGLILGLCLRNSSFLKLKIKK